MMIEGNVNPLWASINNGVFVCLSCSGLHRGLGVQMSQVRSLTLDSWTERQLKSMSLGGNKSLKDFFNTYDLNEESVQTKYRSRASAYYRSKVSTIFLFENWVVKMHGRGSTIRRIWEAFLWLGSWSDRRIGSKIAKWNHSEQSSLLKQHEWDHWGGQGRGATTAARSTT